MIDELPVCRGCGWEYDPNTCHCGTSKEHHYYEEHMFVPYGCTCGYLDRRHDNPNKVQAFNEWKNRIESKGDL